ncbi:MULTISPECIES: protein translocase subunit SecDF [unclassified Flavobacterium]|uniref:protein translocase subunit SecDF n=1 Tax=unclassified Flavobacterium TaxID=196869 RepID=UPI0012927307|nr:MULTISPECIES: protein translocase subunit SecDF [unclassified Flavobacterium]MQP52963.1 protein translocase subunit SecDF [Flavobacterium sp. LMO9]MQP63148.1 protein translocase subunit SecDF [Flavobacterium sp. LMO6]
MQNRGLIKFFAIIFALVCVYQLSFTFVANSIVSDAKAFANGDTAKELRYLDSIGKEKVYLGNTYKEVTNNQINKGLDLEGGLNVILQISVKDVLKGLANDSKNPAFIKALADAKANQQGNQDYIDAFFEAANTAGLKLAAADVFGNRNLDEVIKFDMTNKQVEPIIKQKVQESVESAFKVLRERIDKFGVTQPNIQLLGNSGRILVELPGAKDVDRIKKLLQSTAQLEFWETYKIEEVGQYLMSVEDALKKTEVAINEAPVKTTGIDSLLTDKADTTAAANSPFLGKMLAPGQQGSPHIGTFATKDTAAINGYLKRADIKAMLPANLANIRFAWGKTNEKNPDITDLYALKGTRDNVAPLSGGVIVDATDTFDQLGNPAVSMQMNGNGSRKWEQITGAVSQQGNAIAIVLDNIVYSAPGVSKGAITGGRSEISGNFSIEETKDLANILRAGKLPAAAEIVQSEVVGPSLGQEAIDNGFLSFIIGFSLVLLWMVVYYGKTGFYANLALLINILFIFGTLASFGAVLTLPGIAGIVLTIGMAVDANVIIFERAKEELNNGKSVQEATDYAFTWKGAMSSIIDANITTAITAIILLVFGTGPIQGFATTLLIGIFTSVITAVFVTRMFLDWSLSRNEKLAYSTSLTKNWFKNLNIDFLGKKKIAYAVSGILIALSIFSLATKGLNQGVDFVGGRTYQVRFDKAVSAPEVTSDLVAVFGSAEAKIYGNDNQLKITTKYKIEEEGEGIDKEVNQKLYEGLKKHLPADLTYEKFANLYEGKQIGILSSAKVTGTISKDIKANSLWAVLGSLFVVFVYLMISFRKWQFGFGAVAAVAHDVIIVLGIFSFFYTILPFNMEIDQAFIAAILTVIGYSLNDTVIVFDRIREYLDYNSSPDFKGLVNKALNTTLSRTINTSATTLVVLIAIFIFGGETIRGFVFAILVGILVGTYSSLFIATPVMADAIGKKEGRKMAEFKKED